MQRQFDTRMKQRGTKVPGRNIKPYAPDFPEAHTCGSHVQVNVQGRETEQQYDTQVKSYGHLGQGGLVMVKISCCRLFPEAHACGVHGRSMYSGNAYLEVQDDKEA